MWKQFTWTIPMAGRRPQLAYFRGISASRRIVGDVDPNGIVLKEGVT